MLHDERVQGQAYSREHSKTESLQVALDLTRDQGAWSSRNKDEYLHFLQISLIRTPQFYLMIASKIEQERPLDWNVARACILDALFPRIKLIKSTSQRPAEDWHLIRQHSSILFGKVVDFRRQYSTLGWEFKFELTGCTSDVAESLLQLSDKGAKRRVLSDWIPILLLAQWWEDETPQTRWGWWVLLVGEDDGLILLKCMERSAADQPIIKLPL
eukprot:1590318-Rhodomonas_salina.2